MRMHLSRIAVEVAVLPQTVEQPGTTEAVAGRPSDGISRLTAGLPVPLGRSRERGPRVASASAPDGIPPALDSGVGDEVVRAP